MSETTVSLFSCPVCGLMASELYRRLGDGGGTWHCWRCGHRFGVWLDGGELDLGIKEPE